VALSSVPIRAASGPATSERRAHPRRRLDQLAYIGFGPDSGGVLLDISEGGLRCQIVGPVIEGELCRLRFVLPGRPLAIETDGQVVWSNSSKQGGGVRLLGLDAELRQSLEQWMRDDDRSRSGGSKAPIPIRTKAVVMPHQPAGAVSAIAPTPPAQKAHTLQKRSSSITPEVQPETRPPLAFAPVQPRNGRALLLAAVAGCAVLAIIALAFSDFSSARISGFLRGEQQPDLRAHSAVTTKPAANAPVPSPQAQTEVQRANQPAPASDAVDHSSPVADQPARPQPAISNGAPAHPSQPAQRTPEASNRQQMTMRLSQPRTNNPAVPATEVAPELNTAGIAPPPAPLMDLQSLEGRLPEMSQPSRPSAKSNYQQPVLLSRIEPAYSSYARNARLQGTVQVSFTIGTDGVPRSLVRVSGTSAVVDMAIEAVRRWRYQPATLNGQPIEAQTVASFNFQLR
jgi:TonB family protein